MHLFKQLVGRAHKYMILWAIAISKQASCIFLNKPDSIRIVTFCYTCAFDAFLSEIPMTPSFTIGRIADHVGRRVTIEGWLS